MMKKLFYSASFFLVGITAMATAHAATPGTEIASQVITAKTPEVRLVNTSANAAEGFMALDNTGQLPHILIAAYAPFDQETVLHKTVMRDEHPFMVQIKQIVIPPKKEEDMAFGGVHIMLENLKQPLTPGTSVPLTLIFEDGSALVVSAVVQPS